LFSPIGEDTELQAKYKNLFELIDNMTANRINKRPKCEKILSERHLWSLNLSDLMKEKAKEIKSMEIQIEENFHLYFIQTKLKLQENST